jgi:hypothetical protein
VESKWKRDLLHCAPDGTLTATAIDARSSRFDVGESRPLFKVRPRSSRLDSYPYDVTSDGERILVNEFLEEVVPPLTLIVNWPAAK